MAHPYGAPDSDDRPADPAATARTDTEQVLEALGDRLAEFGIDPSPADVVRVLEPQELRGGSE